MLEKWDLQRGTLLKTELLAIDKNLRSITERETIVLINN